MKNIHLTLFLVLIPALSYAQDNTVAPSNDIMYVTIIQTLFLSIIFGGFLWVIVRGLDKVLDYQKTIADLTQKEHAVKKREKNVMKTLIEAELDANLSKINAHITIYKEMLAELKNNSHNASYQKMGDIFQKQPALQRTVFESNADQLHVLGEQLSSRIIHFYARIKSEPDFENIEPTQSPESVIGVLEGIIENGKKLEAYAQSVLDTIGEKQ